MSIITIDFETYYDKDYSLSKMTTEEYINDPRFEVIGVGIKEDDEPSRWFSGEDVSVALNSIDWEDTVLICHNMMFDGAILAWRYGIFPAMYVDTLCMARAIHGVDAGGSLKVLAERYNIGAKGNEVIEAMGKRRSDFSPADLVRYGEYCCNDVELTYKLFYKLQPFPNNELKLIDLTIRMYTDPVFELNDSLLIARLEEVRTDKGNLLRGLMAGLNVSTEKEVSELLSSNNKFANILNSLGVSPPLKISPATGKETYAFSKTDEGFLALKEHPDEFVQELCRVRLGTKSTIEESRIERFLDVGERNRGKLPIPLKYYGAHTGRWSGTEGINLQNLPSRDKTKKTLKNALVAPPGHLIINCDSSQIEARVLAWLAGETDLVKAFREKRDVYSEFATKVYKRKITKANELERFVGKTCILGLGYGTGAKKLELTLKTSAMRVELEEGKAEEIVKTYRKTNTKIPDLWYEGDKLLANLCGWPTDGRESYEFGNSSVIVDKTGIRLPNDLYIRYPGLNTETKTAEENREAKSYKVYQSRKGKVSIWGGSVVENVVQALARIIIGEQMLKLKERYRVALTVHDAAVLVVSEKEIEEALAFVTETMSTAPKWCSDLPVACEAKYGFSYGDC